MGKNEIPSHSIQLRHTIEITKAFLSFSFDEEPYYLDNVTGFLPHTCTEIH